MPDNFFTVPQDYYKHRYATNITKHYPPIKPKFFSYSNRMYFLVYGTIALSIIVSIQTIEVSNIAGVIMDSARAIRANESQLKQADQSNLNWFLSQGAYLTITMPNQKIIGSSADGIRLVDSSGLSYFTNDLKSKNIRAINLISFLHQSKPESGTYELRLSCKLPGTYLVLVEALNDTGTNLRSISQSVSCNPTISSKLSLQFDKEVIQNTHF